MWARPNVEMAIEFMRYVFKNRQTSEAVGAVAREYIESVCTEERTGAMVLERIKILSE
jgi:1,2-phenylacetyl-CoA epoxidase PaaB subunit